MLFGSTLFHSSGVSASPTLNSGWPVLANVANMDENLLENIMSSDGKGLKYNIFVDIAYN